jgi:hypothetical protein
MTKGAKIAIGVGCGGLLLIGIVVFVGGYFALNYVERNLGETTKKIEAEGREFGKTTDKQGCMKEAVRRSESIGLLDFTGGVALAAFTDACIETSRETKNFCDGVPSFWDMKDTDWAVAECQKVGVDPEKTACVHVYKRKHRFCRPPFK